MSGRTESGDDIANGADSVGGSAAAPAHAARLFTGAMPEPERTSWLPPAVTRWAKSRFSVAPKYLSPFSWDDRGVVTDPGDQGEELKACVSYAACFTVATRFRLLTGQTIALAPRVMHLCTMDLEPRQGTNSRDFEEFAVRSGLPYSTDAGAASQAAALTSQGACGAFASLPRLKIASVPRFETVEALKNEVSTAGPVVAHITLFDDFWTHYQPGTIYRAPVGGAPTGLHAVSLIGFDDARQCWIGVNSRGASWGTNGRFLLQYGQCDLLGKDMPVYSFTLRL